MAGWRGLAGALLMLAASAAAARAQAPSPAPSAAPDVGAGPIYVVTYFDVMPANSRKTATLLHQFAAATRKAVGNTELTVLREIGRPGRFAIVEAWRDKPALEAHGAAMKALGEQLQPAFTSPFETRQFLPLSVGPKPAADLVGAVVVLTHVDVFPAGKEQVAALVKSHAEDSRKDPGMQRFDAVVWEGRPNHFHLIEAWSDRKARNAHVLAEHTRQFRTKVTPFEGALYDERLYQPLR